MLPIRVAAEAWKESIPCDSCHRLSPNGLEFFLENYLAERLRRRFPKQGVELAAPHDPLLKAGQLRLLDYQDSLRLPWDQWFDGYSQGLIYRPRDRMISAEDIRRLDRLGGRLGATHLLLPAKVWMKINPVASNTHTGDMEWGFHLLFWNVAEGRAEWVMALAEQRSQRRSGRGPGRKTGQGPGIRLGQHAFRPGRTVEGRAPLKSVRNSD